MTGRKIFHSSLASAFQRGDGFAAAKFGYSEQVVLQMPKRISAESNLRRRAAMVATLRTHACLAAGVYPQDNDFLMKYAQGYEQMCQQLDCVAVAPGGMVTPAVFAEKFTATRLGFNDLEPNRSVPYDIQDCYLPELTDRRIVIVSSIGHLLMGRANRETFTQVWARIGVPWFSPASVEAVDFPFIYDQSTRQKYPDVWKVYDLVVQELSHRDFDVALIAAGGIGAPIATAVKNLGRVGISLGGHLQVLFGVQGKRWLDDPQWQKNYVNDAWTRPPASALPNAPLGLVDDGAYW